jgi:hypothetical protein
MSRVGTIVIPVIVIPVAACPVGILSCVISKALMALCDSGIERNVFVEENSGEAGDGLSLNEGGELELGLERNGESGKVRQGKMAHDF